MDIRQTGWTPNTPAKDPNRNPNELNRQDFLNLLIAQMSMQDPLNPADPAQFMAQLAQFSNVEQLIRANDKLDQLALSQAAMSGTAVASLVGRTVTVQGDRVTLPTEGSAELAYHLPAAGSEMVLNITDASGKVVRSVPLGELAAGPGRYTWDGRDGSGNRLPAGEYTFSVTGRDSDGEPLTASGRVTGVVTGVSYEKGYPEILIGDLRVALGDVIEVS
ncbi:MAG: flagellar hook assembly protein FlgD [Myxococcales bacterium]|nr:flagellar hook assembly protein FlgD [Myxococcales bacterium]